MKDPSSFVKQLTDPVTKKSFKPAADSPRSEGAFGVALFENAANKTTFDAEPAKFSLAGK